ncbi:MAG: NAD-dependent epimerase/dehydratase family protein [Chthoniobacter sp.]|nr:NAD-dependent epimerase/dehydratase family protein [Chthoniobacter sp.]
MTAYSVLRQELAAEPRVWLITGVAGFIGSHLLEALLRLDQRVVGLDNFSTGSPQNLAEVEARVSPEQWARFTLQKGSVADMGACREASNRVDYVLHHAGFISVPLSLEDPLGCHDTNVTGTLNLLAAARDNRVRRVVYASSSAVYGDDARATKIEAQIGLPLSPYGASKLMDEVYARQFFVHYGLENVGLRYFNVFGPRQNPTGGYAAVIPQWITTLVRGGECSIHGDGGITRDFCHVANVVQANLLAATTRHRASLGEVFNVALGGSTTLAVLYESIAARVAAVTGVPARPVRYGPPRAGDIQHSAADIAAIQRVLHFAPEVSVDEGLDETVRWYAAHAG